MKPTLTRNLVLTAAIALMAFAGHGRDKPIPFGPYLAAAGLIALFWGADIAARWMPFFHFK